jgi:NAD(P)-dependent dehydrogenase (short-subunit alcohol dehydrogenase family)
MATYSATKAGVIGLALTLANELRVTGTPIGVTILCPNNTRDTFVLDAERNRPASAPTAGRAAGVDDLVGVIRDLVDNGQPVEVLARRVVEAVKADALWVFPHPGAQPMIQPRLDALGAVLAAAAQQDIGT